ncbi:MAG: winged helix DNA-binding protein [Allosphingosinicella sp.]
MSVKQFSNVEGCTKRIRKVAADAKYPEALAVSAARRRYKQRRIRDRSLGEHLFRDPAWDILLDLYVADAEGKRISISSACGAAGIPTATGLRWLAKLEKEALIERTPAGSDGRTVYVTLTVQAREKMTGLLSRFTPD